MMTSAILASLLLTPDTVRSEAKRLNLNLGTCVRPDSIREKIDGGKYEQAILETATMVEPENDLKPPAIWLGMDKYDFTNPDYLMGKPGAKGWAQAHGMKVRGHVLVYANDQGYTIPGWLLKMESKISKVQAKAMLRDYIHKVVGRYKGKIAMWDVINEAIDDKPNSRPFNLRDSFWYRQLGPEFLTLAFKFAHEADPKAELYYNEYNIESGGAKAESTLSLAKYVREHGGFISGVGLQYHTSISDPIVPGNGHYKILQKLADHHFSFMITELDLGIEVVAYPSTDSNFGLKAKNPADLIAQGAQYAAIFKMALSFPNCHGVQMWGITDRHSWIPGYMKDHGAGLIFDGQYQRKPGYTSILELLKSMKKH